MHKKILLLLILLIPITKVHSKTINDMYKELEELEKINTNSYKINTEEEIKINKEIEQISEYLNNIEKDIINKESKIEEYQKEIEKKKEECNTLLKYNQLQGKTNYIDYILESNTYTEMIYRYEVIKDLTRYNENLINKINKLEETLEKELINLRDKEQELNIKQIELQNNLNKISSKTKQTIDRTSIIDNINYLNSEINYYKQICSSIYIDIDTCSKITEDAKLYYPTDKGCITKEYQKYRLVNNKPDYHYAIDIGCNKEKTNVYSTTSGTVARIIKESTCGGNQVYIYHTYKGKQYTTLYAHLYSINVNIHDKVDENTIIGTVGGGTTAKINGGYDTCTTGTHLHFGISYGHNANNFSTYSIDPRSLFNFPNIKEGLYNR